MKLTQCPYIARSIQTIVLFLCAINSTIADDQVNQAHTPPASSFRAVGEETLEGFRNSAE